MSNLPDGLSPKHPHFEEDRRPHTLKITDVLGSEYLKLRGLEFDSHCSVWLRRTGESIEVLDTEVRSVWLVTYPEDSAFPQMWEVNQRTADWTRYWEKPFVAAIEALAIEQGKRSHSWELEEEE